MWEEAAEGPSSVVKLNNTMVLRQLLLFYPLSCLLFAVTEQSKVLVKGRR